MNTLKHYIPGSITAGYGPTSVVLIGAGGTGSQLITGLARINQALRALGAQGIDLNVLDGDTVSASNVGRQLFSPADIGRNKAVVLTTRVNLFFGTHWQAHPHHLSQTSLARIPNAEIIISAVDNADTRIQIGDLFRSRNNRYCSYWLDTGNTMNTGQVIMGTIGNIEQPDKHSPQYLPHVLDLYEGIMTEEAEKSYQGPSCSIADALSRQELFVNQWVATSALEIIWHMFRHGYVTTHGAFINLNPLSVRSLPVNPVVWESMGWQKKKKRSSKQYKKAA